MSFLMSGMLTEAEMGNDLLIPSVPEQLLICGSDNLLQMKSSELALIVNCKVNPYGNELMNAAATTGLELYYPVIPQNAAGYIPAGLDHPCSLVPDFGILQDFNNSQFPLIDTQHLSIDDPKKVKRKQIAEEEEESKSMIRKDAILTDKTMRRRKVMMTGAQSNQSHIIEKSENCQKLCNVKLPPAKRSLKLGDKITLLQKLVSPYGKTDTASVLQEAEIYIKQLHTKILNMYELLSFSNIHMNAAVRFAPQEETFVLRRRGLCVIPVPDSSTGFIFT